MACACPALLERPYRYVEDALFGTDADPVIAGCDRVAQIDEKWMSLYRCRTCGTYWVQACATSGMMDIEHLYPLPQDVRDPVQWIRDQGDALPFRPRRP